MLGVAAAAGGGPGAVARRWLLPRPSLHRRRHAVPYECRRTPLPLLQCGRCDGYILEGRELEFYTKKMQKKTGAAKA